MIHFVLLILLCLIDPAYADVFKIANDAEDSALHQAIMHDSSGQYFKNGLDMNLTSSFVPDPFKYEKETLDRRVSEQVNLDRTVVGQVKGMVESSKDDVDVFKGLISDNHPLMLLQYASPSASDLYKYFTTLAHMRVAMAYADLKDKEKALAGDVDYLRDQDDINCLADKIKSNTFKGDFMGALANCHDNRLGPVDIFKHLNDSKVDFNLYEKVLNDVHLKGDRKTEALEILPRWQITSNGYQIFGPQKTIGELIADKRTYYIDKIKDALVAYAEDKEVDHDLLLDLSLPGAPLTGQRIRDLLSLSVEQRDILITHLASELALSETARRYDVTLEYLRRAMVRPITQQAYKKIIVQGIEYLEREKISLDQERSRLRQYAAALSSLIESSDKAKALLIKEDNIEKQHRQFIETATWLGNLQ